MDWTEDSPDLLRRTGGVKLQDAYSIRSVVPHQIILDLMRLNLSIARVPSRSVRAISKRFVSKFMTEAPFPGDENLFGPKASERSSLYNQRCNIRADLLACCLECGLKWMTNQIRLNEPLAGEIQRRLSWFEIDFRKFPFEDFVCGLLVVLGLYEEFEFLNLSRE